MIHRQSIEAILEHCLARLETGESVDACLRDFPEHAEALAPPLHVAADLRRWNAPSLTDAGRSRAHARATAAFRQQHARVQSWRSVWLPAGGTRRALQFAIALVLILATFGSGVAAAQASLPGDVLYSVKRRSETVRLQLAGDDGQRAALYLDFAERRLDEAQRLLVSGRSPYADGLTDLARNYDLAWQLIARADPAKRADLLARYADYVREHQQRLASALALAPTPSDRALLAPAVEASTAAAARLASSPAEPDSPAAATPSPTETMELLVAPPSSPTAPSRATPIPAMAPRRASPTAPATEPNVRQSTKDRGSNQTVAPSPTKTPEVEPTHTAMPSPTAAPLRKQQVKPTRTATPQAGRTSQAEATPTATPQSARARPEQNSQPKAKRRTGSGPTSTPFVQKNITRGKPAAAEPTIGLPGQQGQATATAEVTSAPSVQKSKSKGKPETTAMPARTSQVQKSKPNGRPAGAGPVSAPPIGHNDEPAAEPTVVVEPTTTPRAEKSKPNDKAGATARSTPTPLIQRSKPRDKPSVGAPPSNPPLGHRDEPDAMAEPTSTPFVPKNKKAESKADTEPSVALPEQQNTSKGKPEAPARPYKKLP